MRMGLSFVRSHTHCQLSILTVLLCMYTLTAVKALSTLSSIYMVSVSTCESSTVAVLFLFCPHCAHTSPYQFPQLETQQTCFHTYGLEAGLGKDSKNINICQDQILSHTMFSNYHQNVINTQFLCSMLYQVGVDKVL